MVEETYDKKVAYFSLNRRGICNPIGNIPLFKIFEMDNTNEFDIETESRALKELVSKYDSERLLSDISDLLTQIDSPGILIKPFTALDSPYKQLAYMAGLNISSNKNKIEFHNAPSPLEWKEIVLHTVRAKAGYFDLFLPKANEDKIEFYEFYKIAMPVFMNYFSAGELNFEEQEIERIERMFEKFDLEIEKRFRLKTKDFINIYNFIDEVFQDKLNLVFNLLRDDIGCKEYCDSQIKNKILPDDWHYEGDNENIKKVILFFNDLGEKFKVDKQALYQSLDLHKVDIFFNLFSVKRAETNFLYFTQTNPIDQTPLYELNDGRFLVIYTKQILHAIFYLLENFCLDKTNKIADKFTRHRGKALQKKTEEIFNSFLGKEAHIHNEYTLSPNGDGQDILILYKGVCLIIEVKAGKEPIPPSSPKDTKKVYEIISRKFKNDIQKGYYQTYRVKKFFNSKTDFDIYDDTKKFKHRVKTKNYHSIFSIIVTEERYRKTQIDLSLLLKLDAHDSVYPFSVCIDDLEIILLSLRKLKKGVGDFVKFLGFRQRLQGRLECNDELELWGAFIHNKKFSIPADPKFRFKTFPQMTDIYDDLYNKGLGFKNEKLLDKKKSGKWYIMQPMSRTNFGKK